MPATASHACTECGANFPRTLEFYYKQPTPTNPERLRSACKFCHREREKLSYACDPRWSRDAGRKRTLARQVYARRYYAKHRQRLLAYGKAWRAKKKAEGGT